MFGSTKKGNSSSNGYDIETIIGRNTQFKGVISGEGNIRIDGNLEGEISVGGDVVVGEPGQVVANIKASNILVSGIIQGNVQVSNKLEILGAGRLCGDVNAAVLSIAEGASFEGCSKMASEKKSKASVPLANANDKNEHKK